MDQTVGLWMESAVNIEDQYREQEKAADETQIKETGIKEGDRKFRIKKEVIIMMSIQESGRRATDEAIHSRKLKLADYDRQLGEMGSAGVKGDERDAISIARKRLSHEQGVDKGIVRRQERQKVLRKSEVVFRRMMSR